MSPRRIYAASPPPHTPPQGKIRRSTSTHSSGMRSPSSSARSASTGLASCAATPCCPAVYVTPERIAPQRGDALLDAHRATRLGLCPALLCSLLSALGCVYVPIGGVERRRNGYSGGAVLAATASAPASTPAPDGTTCAATGADASHAMARVPPRARDLRNPACRRHLRYTFLGSTLEFSCSQPDIYKSFYSIKY